MNTPPKEIWLQFYGDGSPAEMLPDDDIETTDVSWCATKMFSHDVKYVRANYPVVPVDSLIELRNRLGTRRNRCQAAGDVNGEFEADNALVELELLIERHRR